MKPNQESGERKMVEKWGSNPIGKVVTLIGMDAVKTGEKENRNTDWFTKKSYKDACELLKEFASDQSVLARAETRREVVDGIENALVELGLEPDGYKTWATTTDEIEEVLNREVLSSLQNEKKGEAK